MAVTEFNFITEKLFVVKGFFCQGELFALKDKLKAGLRREYKYGRRWFKKEPFII